MSDDTEYYDWLAEGGSIRNSVRAIIFNKARDHLLVEQSLLEEEGFLNFPGGGLWIGETFEACLQRELHEETDAVILRSEYRFVVENLIRVPGGVRHGVEHYFELWLDHEDVQGRNPASEYRWVEVSGLGQVDLRPSVVRDCIVAGDLERTRWLVTGA